MVDITKEYRARVTLRISPTITLPADTRAAIKSTGLIGERYVDLVPGASSQTLVPEGTIRYTEAPVDIQETITKFIFGGVENDETGGTAPSENSGDAANMLK
jgi:phospholipid/cholesterol/gamma-HCH transport system substrate-binding protein